MTAPGRFSAPTQFIHDIVNDMSVAAFICEKPTFRHLQYDQYKVSCKGMPDDLEKPPA